MDGMYSISEMADLFAISRQTLIYYDKIGLFKPGFIDSNGYRYYLPTQIPLLRLICILKDSNLPLESIKALINTHTIESMQELLSAQTSVIHEQIDALALKKLGLSERLEFYETAAYWRQHEGVPQLKHFPTRYVLFEPFPDNIIVDRSVLHPTLMRAIFSLRSTFNISPMGGWGTMLLESSFYKSNPIAGAGSFVLVPTVLAKQLPSETIILPEGLYFCISRWGMPYDPEGITSALSLLDHYHLKPQGNAFDFCYLDTTSYTEQHQVDFCCIQIPVALDVNLAHPV